MTVDLGGHEMKASLWGDYLEKKKVMEQKLQLVCKCGNEWEETLPEGCHVRCEKNNNFLVDKRIPQVKKPFKCPSCGRKNIEMLALYRERRCLSPLTYFKGVNVK